MELSYQKRREILDNLNHISDMISHMLWALSEEHEDELDLNSVEFDLKHTQRCVDDLKEDLKKILFDEDKKTELS